ncbi:alpha/beta fold hydrolase [Oceanobacillus sp. 143]|uniref:Alpha/beta hydrolase n=1 Tax=Oceanobacillus zhaokaii TaxID=2052660 RepID=A0A345PIS9_9BACI|nr:alpha/beta hydrolase [Oceanobacillus zhaokaii]AXI09909.1 alpha/beta hydrolase [Oceanobacillus zhaokaii]QGS69122.1 alpha/beta fold hydrolase [Oceanobacillus sp. 143]
MGYYVKVEPTVNIYVEDVNPISEKVILFVHGWPANHKLFEYQFNILPGQGYRCIGIDIRGFGKSDKPWDGYSYDRLADDIRYIVETLGLQNFTLAGHSVGGAIVTRYMARHHGYGVSRLALFAAAAPSFTEQPGFPYGLKKSEVDQLIRQTYQDRPQMLSNFTGMFFFQKLTKPFSDWFFQLGLEAAGYATASLAVSLRDETLFNDIGKIQVPTLILHGVHDRVCLPLLATVLHQGIRNSKLVWFENSGHGLFWEEKDKFNRELLDFIG